VDESPPDFEIHITMCDDDPPTPEEDSETQPDEEEEEEEEKVSQPEVSISSQSWLILSSTFGRFSCIWVGYAFSTSGSPSRHPECSAVARSQLSAASISQAQAILPPQPPEKLELQECATASG
ncbi:TERF2IP isoform 1, partial [Pan troglodytes]